MDIKTRLTQCCGKPVGGYTCSDGMRCPDCFDKLEGWREIERLREALKHYAGGSFDWYDSAVARKALAQKEGE